MKLRAGVLGGGSWGSAVASLISANADTTLWARSAETVSEINEQHTNGKYLPGVNLRKKLIASNDLSEVVHNADVIVVGVPSSGFRETIEKVSSHIRPWVPIISLTKGLEPGTHYRMTQICTEILPDHPAGVLTGPNLAMEIMQGDAAASVLAMENESLLPQLQAIFGTALFRVYTNGDVVGCELAGALKNVIAIATGMSDGAGAGDNTRAAIITRGLAELTRLGEAMGGKPETFAGLAGIGDLLATCTSRLSRNHHVGEELGKGRAIDEIIAEMNMVAEGVKSCRVVLELGQEWDIDMPIAGQVYKVLYEGSTARQAIRSFLRLETGSEADPG